MNIDEIDIFTLNSLPRKMLSKLPKIGGIYFFINNEIIEYVGKSKNIHKRLKLHPKRHLIDRSSGRVAFIEIPSEDERTSVETLLIKKLEPIHNGTHGLKNKRRAARMLAIEK